MHVAAIHTRPFMPPRDNLYELIDAHVPRLTEETVLVVSSKLVAIHQGRCLAMDEVPDKDALITKEAERIVPRALVPGQYAILTIKESTLIPSAGIDESNANGYYVLWPENPNVAAREIWDYVRRRDSLQRLAVIITDSRTVPLRYGTVGIAIGHAGFHPTWSYLGETDIFGRPFKVSRINLVDSLAAAAVLTMGEGNEQTPLALVTGAPHLRFTDADCSQELIVPPDEDIYAPLFACFRDDDR